MPWARLDEDVMQHPKIESLSNAAFRAWICLLCYCQQQLTDGVVTQAAARRACVAADCGTKYRQRKVLEELVVAGLLEHRADGYAIHDYLAWNDSREDVISRREKGRDRVRRHRASEVCNGVTNGETHALPVKCTCVPDQNVLSTISTYNARGTKDMDMVHARAGTFVERYRYDLYPAHRHGAAYTPTRIVEERDFDAATRLCMAYSDDDVARLAELFLTIPDENDKFLARKTRTISMLLSLAPKLAEKLFTKRVTT